MIKKINFLKDESGAVLVIALIMMVIFTMIGIAGSFTSIFEIMISGHKRGSTNAFYSADSGVEVVIADRNNFNLAGNFDTNQKYYYSRRSSNPNPTEADITITHDPARLDCPRGGGMGLSVDCRHYMIESIGQDQVETSLNKSIVTIHEKAVVTVPKISEDGELP